MEYKTFTEIYTANDKIRERLENIVSGLDDRLASVRPEGENWSIAQIVEHISMVDERICKICYKLLSKARESGEAGDGTVVVSPEFLGKFDSIENAKLEAPGPVQPGGEKSIAESLAKLSENRDKLSEIKPLFESLNTINHKFSHPFFGDLSATDWLVLRGGHEARHMNQIERIISKTSAL
jgi:hypothetical protein